jgi:hypothetical protein
LKCWSDRASEDPAGCGLFSLASRTCLIESWGKKIALDERKFCGQDDVAIEQGDDLQGTRISFPLTEQEARNYQAIAEACALYYPLPVLLDGEQLPRKDFLERALYRHAWAGLVLGVVETYWKNQINFHGLIVDTYLPSIQWRWDRTLTAWVEVSDCPQLQLVLPSRKEVVRDQFFDGLQQECRRAIYRYIAQQCASGIPHRLPYEDWLCAKELGIHLPEAEPILKAWMPTTANPDDWEDGEELPVNGHTVICEADLDSPDAQAFWRGFKNAGVRYRLAAPQNNYRGYSWYDCLSALTEVSFAMKFGERALTPDEAAREGRDVRPDAIAITATIAHPDGASETAPFTTDLAFFADGGFHWSYMEDATLFVTEGSTIDADELVELLERSFFSPSDDSSADSWTTQAEDFREEASARAHRLLSCEETARQERIRLVVECHLRWLLPREQETVLRFGAGGALAV